MKKIVMMGLLVLSSSIVQASSLSSDGVEEKSYKLEVFTKELDALDGAVKKLDALADDLRKATENIQSGVPSSSGTTRTDRLILTLKELGALNANLNELDTRSNNLLMAVENNRSRLSASSGASTKVELTNSGPTTQSNSIDSLEQSQSKSLSKAQLEALRVVLHALKADESTFEARIAEVKRFFLEHGPLDVDKLTTTGKILKGAGCERLGEFLDKVALGESTYFVDPIFGRSSAQIILALVAEARSNKNRKTGSVAMLHHLIDFALYTISLSSVDSARDSKYAEESLVRYFKAGDFQGPYNLSKIPSPSNGSETLEVYFEEGSVKNQSIARIYNLLKEADNNPSTPIDATMSVASSGLGFSLGTNSAGLTGVQGTAASSTNNKQGNSASSNSSGSNQQTGWSSYLTPRTFLVVGSLCCVVAFIYKKYGSRAKDETDRQVVPVR